MQGFTFILFGATGDLAMRKIFPALYQAYVDGYFNALKGIIATSRTALSTQEFLEKLNANSKFHIKHLDEEKWQSFVQHISYLSINLNKADDFSMLRQNIALNAQNIVIYFSISPEFFITACKNLALVGLNKEAVKIILEKPLGVDLQSCKDINTSLMDFYNENQIYRIDHYLGKESVQNLLTLRTSNPLLAGLWSKEHIACVELSVFETLGVEGRGEFYDNAGALRDMLQNHMLQIFSLITMQLPPILNAEQLRKAKLELFKKLKPLNDEDIATQVVRAQYSANAGLKGYLEEEKVRKNSTTESFVALRAELLDKNWLGVPFYLRTGKRMAHSFVQLVFHFKNKKDNYANRLIIHLQPEHKLNLSLNIKKSGNTTQSEEKTLHLKLNEESMQPYEKLILDVIEGNQASFNHKEELEAAWAWVEPILQNWNTDKTPLYNYPAGSFGPKEADKLIQQSGYEWHNP
nr:glucose-6-phosphate dehydrogenase [Helicobacter sp.]